MSAHYFDSYEIHKAARKVGLEHEVAENPYQDDDPEKRDVWLNGFIDGMIERMRRNRVKQLTETKSQPTSRLTGS